MAMVSPSPSAVAIEGAPVDRASAKPAPVPVQSTPDSVPEQPMLEALKAAAEQIESYLKSNGRELQFRVDEETGRTVITVRDSVSGEIVRQIPNDEALRLARSLGNQPNVLIDLSI
jgi:flagellar protein FlaG